VSSHLTNEQTNIKRSTATNERGEYVLERGPGNYAVKAILRVQRRRSRRDPDRHAVVLVLDLTMEVGAITENVRTVQRRGLKANASTAVLDSSALQTLPARAAAS